MESMKTLDRKYGSGHKREIYRMELKSRYQKGGESLQEFSSAVERLVHLAHSNTSADYMERIKIDAFIDGIRDPETRRAVMLSPKATFAETIACALTNETAQAITTPSMKIRRVKIGNGTNTERVVTRYGSGSPRCWECGKMGHISRDCREMIQGHGRSPTNPDRSGRRFRGRELRCWICDKVGHISRDCWKTKRKRGRSPSPMQRQPSGEQAVAKQEGPTTGEVRRLQVGLKEQELLSTSDSPITSIPITSLARGGGSVTIKGNIDGKKCVITLDTGATHTVVRGDLIGGVRQLTNGVQLRMANGGSAAITGKKVVRISIGNAGYQHEVLVADIMDEVILGMDFIRANGFVLDFARGLLINDDTELALKFNCADSTVSRFTVNPRKKLPLTPETNTEDTNGNQVKPIINEKYRIMGTGVRMSGDRKRISYNGRVNGRMLERRRTEGSFITQRKEDSPAKLQPTWKEPYWIRKRARRKTKGGTFRAFGLYRGGDSDPVRDEQAWARGSVTVTPMRNSNKLINYSCKRTSSGI